VSDLSFGIGLPIKSCMFSGDQSASTPPQQCDELLAELEQEERRLPRDALVDTRELEERIHRLEVTLGISEPDPWAGANKLP
jgi:hypothetical protein